MNKKVLFADKPHPVLEERLSAAGFICEHFSGSSLSELQSDICGYGGIIVRSRTKLTAEILSKAIQLKFAGRLGSGMENIDTEYAKNKGSFALVRLKETAMPWVSMHWECCWH